MAVQLYGQYILFSRPTWAPDLRRWLPYASITWSQEHEAYHHQLTTVKSAFDAEPEALAFGFTAARAWIHRNFGMDEDYKGHHIRARADQDRDNKKWLPMAHVSWNENGTLRYRTFFCPLDWHRSKEEAVDSAAAVATKWIDNGKPI
jgi:hypothetical protein